MSRYPVKWFGLFFPLLLVGCASFAPMQAGTDGTSSLNRVSSEKSRSQHLLSSGIEYLSKGELEKAQAVFNSALKFDLMNPQLHFFNALTYQLKYEQGEADSFDLADIGYKNALSLDNSLDAAYMQLGKLYLSAKRYADASKAFALATYNRPNRASESLIGLIHSSMLAGDLETAAWAVDQLETAKNQDPRFFRAKAFLAALAKQPQAATDMLANFAKLDNNSKETRYVASRLDQLLAIQTHYASTAKPPFDASSVKPKTESVKIANNVKENSDDKSSALPADARKNWFRCDPRPAPIAEKDLPTLIPINALPVSDETAIGVTLPAPCTGERPPTATIEVTLIRTEETLMKSYGVNLLDGLTLGRSVVQAADGTVTRTASLFNTLGADVAATPVGVLPATTGYLSYSLNIANSQYTKNEVIARPSLAAVDRLPAVFFSGGNLSIKVAGTSGGVSQVVDKSVGLSLSITPTFLENEEVMLNIRASRSALDLNPDISNIALNLTRDSVNAVALVKFGQTFVLNGLVSTTKSQENSGVPILGDIPVLQLLFKTSKSLDMNRQILTLITVRKTYDSEDFLGAAKNFSPHFIKHKLSDQVEEFTALQDFLVQRKVQVGASQVLVGLKQNPMSYKYLSPRDLIPETMTSKKDFNKLLESMKDSYAY